MCTQIGFMALKPIIRYVYSYLFTRWNHGIIDVGSFQNNFQ